MIRRVLYVLYIATPFFKCKECGHRWRGYN
ncbi:hypothetical protein [Halorubrum laminariae]|uniref:TFIIS-type domain-containing protein n=1 Tax=Halorubrum laminariae TaxID=1433523 RepID=A0ABD6BY70_9EURY